MSAPPSVDVVPVALDEFLAMREEHRREMACQIVHDSWHRRGFTHSYALRVRGEVVGYGSVGGAPRDDERVVKELFVRTPHRGEALPLFRALVAATGGFATHYNPPYADVYMEVAAAHRRRGLGSYLVQERKRLGREAGFVPAARCHHANVASRRTLQRGGMIPCARIVRGRLA